jgi:hypothetical protein
VVGDGQEIYSERLDVEDALNRIEALYKPYHRALRRLLNKAHQAFGTVILVDCHSMPSIGVTRDEPKRPDIVIGDRYGTSCASLLPDVVEETLTAQGYSVGRNKPYAGGFITEHYGNPASGLHMRSSLNSTAQFTWMSGGASADHISGRWLTISSCWPTRWRQSHSTISDHSRRRQNKFLVAVAASKHWPRKKGHSQMMQVAQV